MSRELTVTCPFCGQENIVEFRTITDTSYCDMTCWNCFETFHFSMTIFTRVLMPTECIGCDKWSKRSGSCLGDGRNCQRTVVG